MVLVIKKPAGHLVEACPGFCPNGSDWLLANFSYFSIAWHVLFFWSNESCCNICHTFCDLASSHRTMNQIWLRLFFVSSRALWTCSPLWELPRPRPPRSPDGLLHVWCRQSWQSWLVELGDDMRFWESWRLKPASKPLESKFLRGSFPTRIILKYYNLIHKEIGNTHIQTMTVIMVVVRVQSPEV